MSKLPAKFFGGSLDGKVLPGVCARDYWHPKTPIIAEVYRRSRTAYIDGDGHATDFNQGRVTHLEYTFLETRPVMRQPVAGVEDANE